MQCDMRMRERTDRSSAGTAALFEHRRQIRNLIASIRAVVQRTAPGSTTVNDYVAHLSGRLDAMARVQEILMREEHAAVDLLELLTDEFLRQGLSGRNAQLPTTSLFVDRTVAASLALALHELATNAVKFGQLDDPSRRLQLSWTVSPHSPGWAWLRWREEPLPPGSPVAGPAGFGFELLRRTLPYEIDAHTRVELSARGLEVDIEFPGAKGGEPHE